jgi:EmrB/QacA subfamily drug resistance transporter
MERLMPDSNDSQRYGRGGVLFSMCLALVLVVASVSALNLALPSIAIDLNATDTDLTWIADAYTVALAALVLPFGALGDRWGRRRLLVAGTVLFGAASLAAAFAQSPHVLIALRTVMGVAAAMIMPGTLSTITSALSAAEQKRGVAIWAGFASAGGILGLLVAGALLEPFDWRSVFVASAGLAVTAGLAATLLAPDTREAERRTVDGLGAATVALAVGSLVYGIIEGGEIGWMQPRPLVALAIAAAAIAVWVFSSLRHPEPMLDPRLYGFEGFRAGSAVVLVQFLVIFGFLFVGIQYLQIVLGYGPLKSAVALVPIALVILPASMAGPSLADRVGLRVVLTCGLALLAVGVALLALMSVDSGYGAFLVALLVAGLGFGIASATATSAVVSSLPRDRQGVASAVNDANREIGSAIGIAVVGSIFNRGYDESLPSSIDQLPGPAAEAVHRSAAAGVEVASRLGAGQDALLATVRDSFMHGFSNAMWAVAAIAAVFAVVTFIRLRVLARAQAGDRATAASAGA